MIMKHSKSAKLPDLPLLLNGIDPTLRIGESKYKESSVLTMTISSLKKLKYFTSLVELLGTPKSTSKPSLRTSHLFSLYLLIKCYST